MLRTAIAVVLAVAVLAAAVPVVAQEFPPASKEAEAKLIAVLKAADASREAKATACRRLAVIGTETAVPVLAGLLGDAALSHMARYALEPMAYASAGAAFRDALGKVKGKPLVGVIGSLGVRRDTRAVPAIAAMLDSADSDIAQAAPRALGTIGTVEAAAALKGALKPGASRQVAVARFEGLLRCAERLADDGKAADAVGVYDMLRGLNKTAPHQVRTAATRGAILARGAGGLTLLTECLASDDWLLFAAACRTSHEMDGKDVTAALAAAAGRGSADQKILALLTLGRRADAAALPAVLAAAKAGDKAVRLQAIRTVAEINNPAAVGDLVALVTAGDGDVAKAARESLAGLPGEAVNAAVMTMFRGADADRRLIAMELIARRRLTAAVPDLLKVARGSEANLRAPAVKHLGDLAGTETLPALLDILMTAPDGAVLGAATGAVSTISAKAADPNACAGQVVARMPKADATRKVALLNVLGSVGGQAALAAVHGAVGDANKDVHTAAIRTLAGWKTPDVLPVLAAVAKAASDDRDRTLALRGYTGWAKRGGRGGLPGGQRVDICRNTAALAKSTGDKKLLLGALGQLRTPASLKMIVPYVDDDAVRTEACSAAVSVAEELLKVGGGSKFAAAVVGPLEKVAKAAKGDLAKRAEGLLKRARSKAKK